MCAKGNIRHFLQQRQGYLAEKIHVRRLLLSDSMRGIIVFTTEERQSILKEESESSKTNLFLQTLFSKDDGALVKFVESLKEKQSGLEILQEWDNYEINQTAELQTDRLSTTREPVESIDESSVDRMGTSSINFQFNDNKLSECDFCGGDRADLKPEPLTPSSMPNIPPLTPTMSEKELNISGDSKLTTDILKNINRLVTLSEDEKNSLENRLNQAVQDQDVIRDANLKLLDVLVEMVKQGKLSPNLVEQVLREVDQEQLAERLLSLTVRDKYLGDMSHATWTKLKQELSVENTDLEGKNWKSLPEWLGIKEEVHVQFLDQRTKFPAEEILHIWMKKRCATVVNLYKILSDKGLTTAAAILEPELPVNFFQPQSEFVDECLSLGTCDSNMGF